MTLIIQFATDRKLLAQSNGIMYSYLSSAKKDQEVTVNTRVSISQDRAVTAEGCTQAYVTRSADITGGTYYLLFIINIIIFIIKECPFTWHAEAASGISHPVLGSQFKTDVEEFRKTQQRATKMLRAYSK